MENKIEKAVAERDITCYKVFYQKRGYKAIVTPFRQFRMYLKRLYTTKDCDCPYAVGKQYIVEGGCFHSFKSRQGANGFIKSQKKYDGTKGFYLVAVKCIIPKGSAYYTGTFYGSQGDYKAYASTRIQPIEIVK